ncbi:hypothetical protein E1263_05380 [Kribbella antibiotica]|uniref:VWA domain-containing protein n=1 Tax=Kribbella antibiotica TaxID=190195 RepID=A0A4R4ZV23_9ACTN|nr:hypothetical protein [Kribbella antibiotica]TDD62044.1 hypothetical protein E1263_05380 [Kribbella antibiotica]
MKSTTLSAQAHIVAVLVALVLLVGCGPKPEIGQLADDRQILKTCPNDTKYATKLDLDVSGSGRTPELDAARLDIVKEQARSTAICGGHLLVTAFSATSAATVALYDEELTLPGATDNARLRRVSNLVDDISNKVAAAYPPAIKKVSPAQSDITAQFRLAAEYRNQLGSTYRLRLVILTDGFQTVGRRVTTPVEIADARAVGMTVNVPRLPEAFVTVAGIGKVAAGSAPSSGMTNALIGFWDGVCRRSQAAQCTIVTDYIAGR